METLFVGRNMIFLPEVESTNSYAIGLLKNVNIEEGSVVYTAKQTNGKGQRGNVWEAEAQSNLTASIILRPAFLDIKKQFFLYKIAALATYDVMAGFLNTGQFDIKIKWPNDLLVNRKKIAGILIENIVVNNQMAYSVIGIGINVLQNKFDPAYRATSLKLLSDANFSVEDVLQKLCVQLEKYYLLLKNRKDESINSAYIERSLAMGNWQDFEIGNKVKKMRVKGTSESGLLCLQEENGNVKEFDVKEVRWIL